MFEFLVSIAFVWMVIQVLGLVFKVTWGLAKIVAVVLFVLALPAMIVGLVVAGGVALLIPVALVGAAFGILKSCV